MPAFTNGGGASSGGGGTPAPNISTGGSHFGIGDSGNNRRFVDQVQNPFNAQLAQIVEQSKTDPAGALTRLNQSWSRFQSDVQSFGTLGGPMYQSALAGLATLRPLVTQITQSLQQRTTQAPTPAPTPAPTEAPAPPATPSPTPTSPATPYTSGPGGTAPHHWWDDLIMGGAGAVGGIIGGLGGGSQPSTPSTPAPTGSTPPAGTPPATPATRAPGSRFPWQQLLGAGSSIVGSILNSRAQSQQNQRLIEQNAMNDKLTRQQLDQRNMYGSLVLPSLMQGLRRNDSALLQQIKAKQGYDPTTFTGA